MAIPGATAADYLPVAADDLAEISCAVTASNAAGSLEAVTDPVRVTQVAPVAAGSLGDLELEQGSGDFVVPMAPHFSGAALSFAVTGAGARIDAATGVLSLPTDTAMAAALVTVTVDQFGRQRRRRVQGDGGGAARRPGGPGSDRRSDVRAGQRRRRPSRPRPASPAKA